MVLADTNILSTFAKIDQLVLLLQLFTDDRLGVVPAVYAEFQAGVQRGYTNLQAVIELIQQRRIDLIAPNVHEIFQKDGLPASFDAGERETITVAKARRYAILTNEVQVKNWCRREQVEYFDLPGILRALWKTNLVQKDQAQSLIDQIEARDRVLFKNKEWILEE